MYDKGCVTVCIGRPPRTHRKNERPFTPLPAAPSPVLRQQSRLAHGSCGAPSAPRQPRRFEQADFRLSSAKPFSWRRNLFPQPLVADRTVFNYMATYNDFERRFARFLDTVPDDLRFASLDTTEQGESGMLFHINYLKPSGAIGFYYPEWGAVQMTRQGEVNWVIETKGRVWEDTTAKDTAMRDWCARISQQTGQRWNTHVSTSLPLRPKSHIRWRMQRR
jgi:hypothetical protein